MILTENTRHSCSLIVNELEDAVNIYQTRLTERDAFVLEIEKLEQRRSELQSQLSNTDQNDLSSLESQISKLAEKIRNSHAFLNELRKKLSDARYKVDQLSNEYDQNRCAQYFHKPRIF